MTQKETYKYDQRTKTLYRKVTDEDNIKLNGKDSGKYKIVNEQEYDEEGIRQLIGELKNQRVQIEEMLSKVNKTLDSTNHLEEDNALVELRENLKKLQMIDKRLQAKEQRDNLLDSHRVVAEQMNNIRQAVNGQLDIE